MSSSEGMQGKKRPSLPSINRADPSIEVKSSTVTTHTTSASLDKNLSARTSPVFLNFSFYKVDPKWRWLNELGKEEAAKEFTSLIEVANTKMKVRIYSTLGLREDSEFMLWMISESVEKMQVFTSKVYLTVFGKYIESSK